MTYRIAAYLSFASAFLNVAAGNRRVAAFLALVACLMFTLYDFTRPVAASAPPAGEAER